MAPKTGAIRPKYHRGWEAAQKDLASVAVHLQVSETEIGEIAVANSNAGACRQQFIESGHEAAEKSR
jgi:hypothetical protein